MTAVVAWKAALIRCGYDNASIDYLGVQGGVNSVETLQSVSVPGVKDLIRGLAKSASYVQVAAGQTKPSFSYLREKKLEAFRMWIEYRSIRGQEFPSTGFTAAAIVRWSERINDLALIKADDSTVIKTEPPKLKDFEKWELWEELFTTYLSHIRNTTTGTPFTYLTRDEIPAEPPQTPAQRTAELLLLDSQSIDEDLIASSQHNGSSFTRDNRTLFDLIQQLTIEGTVWTYIERYKASRNGRAAFLQLKTQANGAGAITVKRNKAYNAINNAHFTGRGNFTLERYVGVHQDSHNKLESTGEPVPETKKVTDFLNGIQCEELKYAKAAVLADPVYQSNFDACQRYITTAYTSTMTMKKAGRHVGAISQEVKKRFGKNPTYPKKGKPTGGPKHYPPLEWKALTEAAKETHREERRKWKASRNQRERKVSAMKAAANDTFDYDKLALAIEKRQALQISSVTSNPDEDTVNSAMTIQTPKAVPAETIAERKAALKVSQADELKAFQATQLQQFNKAAALFAEAKEKSAGGQFGRGGSKLSFPKAAIAAAKKKDSVGVGSVRTVHSPRVSPSKSFTTAEEALSALTKKSSALTDTDTDTTTETTAVVATKLTRGRTKSPARNRRLPTRASKALTATKDTESDPTASQPRKKRRTVKQSNCTTN